MENVLKTSCLALKMAVDDPLPKAIAMDAKMSSDAIRETTYDGEHEGIQCEEGARRMPSTVETKENSGEGNLEQGGKCSSLALNQKPPAENNWKEIRETGNQIRGMWLQQVVTVCGNSTTSVEMIKLSGPPKHNLTDWHPTAHTYEVH